MERPNTVAGLIEKRRELVARLERARAEIKTLISGLDALDITLKLFGAEGSNAKPMRLPPAHPAAKGEFQRAALDLFRETGGPISSRMVATRFCETRGLDLDDAAFRSIRCRASSGLWSAQSSEPMPEPWLQVRHLAHAAAPPGTQPPGRSAAGRLH